MKTKYFFRLSIDGQTIDYPCSDWEVSCILVPQSLTKKYVEFKKYLPDGKQVVESHYVDSFNIIERLSQPTPEEIELYNQLKQNNVFAIDYSHIKK